MKNLFFITLLICFKCSFSQTKDKLIRSILQSKSLQLDPGNSNSPYNNELNKLLSRDELLKFSIDYNPILRMYVKLGLIKKGKGGAIKFLIDEIKRNSNIVVFDACLGEQQNTAGILYQEYFNNKVLDTIKYFKSKKKDIKFDKAEKIVSKNKIVQKMDSIIIFSDIEVSGQIWNRIINKKSLKKYRSRIEELAFNNNNYYAFINLTKKFKNKYLKQTDNFFNKKFLKIDFDSYHKRTHLIHYLDYLLNSGNEHLESIAIEKVKKEKWKKHEFEFLIIDNLKEKGIELDNDKNRK